MTHPNTRRGFTLIELLVVVLIIGILAAVAVPQYQMAVAKARFANLKAVAQIYARAAKASKLETGQYPQTFEELSVDVPGASRLSAEQNDVTCAANDQMYCCIMRALPKKQYDAIICALPDYSLAYSWEADKRNVCWAKPNTYADKMCQSLGGIKTNSWGNNLIIPGGGSVSGNRYNF